VPEARRGGGRSRCDAPWIQMQTNSLQSGRIVRKTRDVYEIVRAFDFRTDP
jgi:hypothetical protein